MSRPRRIDARAMTSHAGLIAVRLAITNQSPMRLIHPLGENRSTIPICQDRFPLSRHSSVRVLTAL